VIAADLAIEVAGAVLVLAAYALAQFGGLARGGYPYLLLNLIGATALAVAAARHHEWGFLLLQAVWALVAALGVGRRLGNRGG